MGYLAIAQVGGGFSMVAPPASSRLPSRRFLPHRKRRCCLSAVARIALAWHGSWDAGAQPASPEHTPVSFKFPLLSAPSAQLAFLAVPPTSPSPPAMLLLVPFKCPCCHIAHLSHSFTLSTFLFF
eukprot:GGOE01011653.1.p2 GENE.GGOE01011653.1~~GGOE01011653.1.p2  ORF type:complete len:125 (-),score=3.63 GGOE01011653.1:291-665(-)